MKNLFFLILIIIFVFDCGGNQSKLNKEKETYNLSLMIYYLYRSEGNCIRYQKTTEGWTIYCDQRSRGLCNTSDLIYTDSEKSAALSEISKINRELPNRCSQAILVSGVLQEKTLSLSEGDKINQENAYVVVASCVETGIQNANLLVNTSDLSFLNSTKGKIAIASEQTYNFEPDPVRKADALACLDYLIKDSFSGKPKEDLRTLLSDNRTKKRWKQVSCVNNSSLTTCPPQVIH
ncbi:hypothetical protein [Leptospira ilyithenensis]|uniref:Uncharacterized protein n=1 Tax=Leptospira ilyithenensis TaxID=2484901 RepID=A0A4R9LN41_9LEPT|nr:hypothetical protein [Leptospira ilyithenensis]TGN10055.1 hypothetical protein EHS11_10865 [Leptospira ilyithenensis]